MNHGHRLDQLPSGTRGVVRRIDSADAALHRLMAMGLCLGRSVEIVRQGSPLILRLLGAHIGVSSRVARQIVIEPTPDESLPSDAR
jgi:Fe2+ transport system protein FeoA